MGRTGIVGGVAVAVAAVTAAVFWMQPGWFGVADPLIGEGGRAGLCTPGQPDGTLTLGELAVTNDTGHEVVVDAVHLRGADGVRLAGSFLAPVDRDGVTNLLMGSTQPYPPRLDEATSVWPQRVPLSGAVLRPGDYRQIVLGLIPSGAVRTWSFSGFTVGYHSGLRHWTGRLDLTVRTVAGVSCP